MPAYATESVSIGLLQSYLDGLASLLHACVQDGASVNFLLPFSVDEALQFWRSQEADIQAGRTILCVATSSTASLAGSSGSKTILGCVLVKLAQQPNQRHRADIGKMLVSPEARRRGIGKALLDAAEREAKKHGRWLLCLDTEAGSAGESLYLKQGYIAVGAIPDYALLNDGKSYTAALIMYKHLGRPKTGRSSF